MAVLRSDVIDCYKTILSRDPENEMAILSHISDEKSVMQLVSHFASSPEFKRKAHVFSLEKCEKDYLSKRFERSLRQHAFCHHYSLMSDRLNKGVLEHLQRGGKIIVDIPMIQNATKLSIEIPNIFCAEGELSLSLDVEGHRIQTVSFSFISASITKADDAVCIFRMQGGINMTTEIKRFASSLNGMSPQRFLHECVVGISRSFDYENLYGVCHKNQISCNVANLHQFEKRYDDFYKTCGFDVDGSGLFRAPVNSRHQSKTTGSSKRRRSIARRVDREQVSSFMAAYWTSLCA